MGKLALDHLCHRALLQHQHDQARLLGNAAREGGTAAIDQLGDNHTVQLVGQTAVIENQLAELLSGELAHLAPGRDRRLS